MTHTKTSELVSVELTDNYLEFWMDGVIIYDFKAVELQKFLPLLKCKTWFTPELEMMSNLLSKGVNNG